MSRAPIQILAEAHNLGLRIGFEPPDTLTFEPMDRCPGEFLDVLSQHKPQLLALLQLPFVMVDSRTIGEILYFCADEQTKAALIEAGASELSIYTRDELKILVEQNRVAPISESELCKIHEIKKNFNARIMK